MIRSSKSAPAASLALIVTLAASSAAFAQQPGITDTEIKFGNIMPYSGPASALSVTGKVFAAYVDMVNEKGGVNGRKLNTGESGEFNHAAMRLARYSSSQPAVLRRRRMESLPGALRVRL